MKEIELDALVQNIPELTSFVEDFVEAYDCPIKAMMQLDVAIDEIISNIAQYAYPDGTGKVKIIAQYMEAPKGIKLIFEDKGIRYNPLEKEDPNTNIPLEERQIGGLGIFIVKKTMDCMEYTYENGKNILTIVKNF